MLWYLSLVIICSAKLTVFFELLSQKTVRFSEQIMSAEKYPSNFRAKWRLLYTYAKFLLWLTTGWLNGGWVPETSRSFHYWQLALRRKPLPRLANPGNRAVSPHVEGETATCHTELTVEGGGEGRGDVWRHAPMQSNPHCKRYRCEACRHTSQSNCI